MSQCKRPAIDQHQSSFTCSRATDWHDDPFVLSYGNILNRLPASLPAAERRLVAHFKRTLGEGLAVTQSSSHHTTLELFEMTASTKMDAGSRDAAQLAASASQITCRKHQRLMKTGESRGHYLSLSGTDFVHHADNSFSHVTLLYVTCCSDDAVLPVRFGSGVVGDYLPYPSNYSTI